MIRWLALALVVAGCPAPARESPAVQPAPRPEADVASSDPRDDGGPSATASTTGDARPDEGDAGADARVAGILEFLRRQRLEPVEREPLDIPELADLAREAKCRRDSFPTVAREHLEVLGMLDEYISRFDYFSGAPRSRLVEHFYPHETAVADDFGRLLDRSFGKAGRYERRVDGEGHIMFEGQEVADAINAFYVPLPGTKVVTLDPCVVRSWDDAQSKAFLRGMRRRFGQDAAPGVTSISMANAGGKMAIAAALAKRLKARGVRFERRDTLPTIYDLTFSGVDLAP